jgi:Ycf66 protein N-terminus
MNTLLGWVISFGSLGFYLAGFLLPEVRRKKDAIWSGVGLIYALALLTNGDRISFGLLLGELASATLIGWFGWQILQQRRELSESTSQTQIPNSVQAVFPFLKEGWGRLLATYTDPEDDGEDLLASGFKKVAALLAGESDRYETAIATPSRPEHEVTPVYPASEDEWGDDQPSETSSSDEAPVQTSIETSAPIVESAEQQESEQLEPEPTEPEPVEPEVLDSELEPEPVKPEPEPEPVEPEPELETVEAEAVNEVTPSEEPFVVSETIAVSTEQPDTEQPDTEQPDTEQPDTEQPEANSSAGNEENWPPKGSGI